MHRAISRPIMVKVAVVSRAERTINGIRHLSMSAVVDTGFSAFHANTFDTENLRVCEKILKVY